MGTIKKADLRVVYVRTLPRCNFCLENAKYDGRTRTGPWAYMCPMHFRAYGIGLGLGKGQELKIIPDAVVIPAKVVKP